MKSALLSLAKFASKKLARTTNVLSSLVKTESLTASKNCVKMDVRSSHVIVKKLSVKIVKK